MGAERNSIPRYMFEVSEGSESNHTAEVASRVAKGFQEKSPGGVWNRWSLAHPEENLDILVKDA